MRVGLGVASAFYGWRAIHRYVVHLALELPPLDPSVDYRLFSWRFREPRNRPSLPPESAQVRHCWTRLPGKVLTALWDRGLGPSVERFTGPLDLYHALDLDVPTCRRARKVFTLHGVSCLVRPDLFPPGELQAVRRILDRATRCCDLFLAVSEQTRREFLEVYPFAEGRVGVTPLGIDPSFGPEAAPEDRGILESLGARPPYLLFVGALSRLKNVATLLEAHRVLVEEGRPDLQLVLAGDFPPEETALRSAVNEARRARRVVVTGWLPPTGGRLEALYRHGAAFVFPSLTEGWTSPPLEAMASGLPVVASNVSSLPETVGDAALLSDPLDAEALADGIRRLLEDPALRRDMVERGLRRASRFTWRRCAEQTLEAYRGLVG